MKLLKIMGVTTFFAAAIGMTSIAAAGPAKRSTVRVNNTLGFGALDRNNDGRIGAREYRRGVSQAFARWMSRVDTNRDGYLTGAERRRALKNSPVVWPAKFRTGPVPLWLLWSKHMERANADFRRLDRNDNGFVSRREFRRDNRYSTKEPRRGRRPVRAYAWR